MRFILNFIFFGILFYLIWLYFPDAFNTMLSWVQNIVDYIKAFVETLAEKTKSTHS